MVTFLSTPFFPTKHLARYGQPHILFDVLQLVFSYLLLSPTSQMAHAVRSSRENYDLARVYNWRLPFATLYRRAPETDLDQPVRSSTRSTRALQRILPQVPKPEFELDSHALVHIRNFWHRHLVENHHSSHGFNQTSTTAENTYARMASNLAEIGSTPKKWDKPLSDEGLLDVAEEWHGHYSCLHPWPKKRQQLEEMQTCAEDWRVVDPLVSGPLDLMSFSLRQSL